jgi:hypothetical protein
LYEGSARPVNLARYCFLDPSAGDFYPDWADAADTTVALLRTEAGRDPYNRALTDLVGELATRSDAFRTRWAAHDVRLHHTGTKRFRHPLVGDLTVGFNATELPADPGLTLTVYTAEPGSESAEKLGAPRRLGGDVGPGTAPSRSRDSLAPSGPVHLDPVVLRGVSRRWPGAAGSRAEH